MFGVDWQELLIIGIVALLVIGPKDLPRAMRVAGQWVGKARATARHFRTGIDTMIREAELEEMNERWAAQNKAIMAGTPATEPDYASDLVEAVAPSPRSADAESPSPLKGEGGGRRSVPSPLREEGDLTPSGGKRGEGVAAPKRKRAPAKSKP